MSGQCNNGQIERLLKFLISMPLPDSYHEILQEQISCCSIRVEQYSDCLKILFENHGNTRTFPTELPTLLQGGQILKESGPLSFILLIEKGYVVQFEVVDSGLNEIDWVCFWSHTPIYDVEYD